MQYIYLRIAGDFKKNSGHLDLLFKQIENIVIKAATFFIGLTSRYMYVLWRVHIRSHS